jgi:hypothetical protein
LFTVLCENIFDDNVLAARALSILTRLILMTRLGDVGPELKSMTKDLVPWKLGKIQYIGLATDNTLLTDINKSDKPKRKEERRMEIEKKGINQVKTDAFQEVDVSLLHHVHATGVP